MLWSSNQTLHADITELLYTVKQCCFQEQITKTISERKTGCLFRIHEQVETIVFCYCFFTVLTTNPAYIIPECLSFWPLMMILSPLFMVQRDERWGRMMEFFKKAFLLPPRVTGSQSDARI